MKNLEQLKSNLDAAILNCIYVPNEILPERFHDNREGVTSLARINKILDGKISEDKYVDPESVSVKFDVSEGDSDENRKIVSGTPERLAKLEKYRNDVASGEEIGYNINSYKLDRNMRTFATLMNIELEE